MTHCSILVELTCYVQIIFVPRGIVFTSLGFPFVEIRKNLIELTVQTVHLNENWRSMPFTVNCEVGVVGGI